MKINMKTLAAGPDGNYGPGVCEVPDEVAKAFIEAGFAEPVEKVKSSPAKPEEPEVETAELPTQDVEQAVVPTPKRGSRKK